MSTAQLTSHAGTLCPPPAAWLSADSKKFGAPVGADEDARALQSIATKVRFARNQAIFREGDTHQNAYKVVSGVVRLCRHLADGRRQIVQFLFPSDFFNIMGLGEQGFSAEAVSDVVLMSYPQHAFAKLSDERASIQNRFLNLLSQRLTDIQCHLMMLGRQSAKERVAAFLLKLAERTGSEEDEIIDLPMSRQDIADYLGLRIETVSRILSQMKQQKLIDARDLYQFALLDPEALQALANGEESEQ
jgi:CRP/FNR family nitrogen fixation transcriptional regulator